MLALSNPHDIRTQEWNQGVWEKYSRAEEVERVRVEANGGSKKVDWDGEVQRHQSDLSNQIAVERDAIREVFVRRSRGGRGAEISRLRMIRREQLAERNRRLAARSPSPELIAPKLETTEENDEGEADVEDEVDVHMEIDGEESEVDVVQRSRSVSLGEVMNIKRVSAWHICFCISLFTWFA